MKYETENKPLLDIVSGQMSVSVLINVPWETLGLVRGILSRAFSWVKWTEMSGLVWWTRRTAYCLAQVCEHLCLNSVCWQHLTFIANIYFCLHIILINRSAQFKELSLSSLWGRPFSLSNRTPRICLNWDLITVPPEGCTFMNLCNVPSWSLHL